MFRTVAIVVFLATLAGIVLHCVACGHREKRRPSGGMLGKVVHLFTLLLLEQKLSLVGVFKKLVYLLAMLCFVVLAITGFYPLLIRGEHISGYLMMVHATFSPVFAICLAVLAVMWASSYRLKKDDCPLVHNLLRRVTRPKRPAETGGCGAVVIVEKITFWLVLFLALPLALSVVSSMFPLFGTHWQEILLAAHRWTAVIFAVAAITHTYLVIRAQMRQ